MTQAMNHPAVQDCQDGTSDQEDGVDTRPDLVIQAYYLIDTSQNDADKHDDHQRNAQTLGLRCSLIVPLLFGLVGKGIETQAPNIQGHELSDKDNDIVLWWEVDKRQELDRRIQDGGHEDRLSGFSG
jgi:hypothetical protein